MSYSTTYRSPSLDESTKPRDKNIARIGAVIITALVILIIFWRFFSRLDPKPEAGGVMASFGNVAIAGSGSAENDSDNPKTNPTPPVDPKVDKVETNDDIKSESVKTEKTPKTDTKTTETNTKSEEGPKGPNFGDFKGNGKDKGNGQIGTNDGKNPFPTYGSGKGTKGDGVDEGNSGRTCRENCTSCSVGGTWEEVGDAYIVVEVTPDGKVVSSRLADVKKYPQNAQFFGRQKIIAENCAMQRVYDTNSETSKNIHMVVKIGFRKG